jgi:hypothetical protein
MKNEANENTNNLREDETKQTQKKTDGVIFQYISKA